MERKGWIIFAAIVLLFLLFLYGTPAEIKFTGTPPFVEMTWKIQTPDPKKIERPQGIESKARDIIIEELNPRQEIYQPEDIAYVDFKIKNTLGIPYNLTVDWLFNNTRHKGWFNISTDVYNTTDEINRWWSNYPAKKAIGNWEVHLFVTYNISNESYSKDKTTTFRVI